MVQAVKEAEWKRKRIALKTFKSACAGAKDLIIYGVGEDAVVVIKKQYVGYRDMIPKRMMQHICDKTCTKTKVLDKAKKNGHNTPWDTTSEINIYWKYLYDLNRKIESKDIATRGDEKVSIAIAQIWESD